MDITVPFLKQPVGAGDVVKAATSAVGIKPCTPCEERRKRMNGALHFVPRENPWGKPPNVPEGWVQEASFESPEKKIQLFRHTSGQLIIWNVTTGEYRNSHTFGCGKPTPGCDERVRDLVQAKWEELCRS